LSQFFQNSSSDILNTFSQDVDSEIGHFRNFQTSVTLTLDPSQGHTTVHYSSTSIFYTTISFKSETFCGRTCMYGRTDTETTRRSRLKNTRYDGVE